MSASFSKLKISAYVILLMSSLATFFVSLAHAQDVKPALEPVTFRVGYRISAVHSGFAYGADKGIFAAEGIELKLEEGRGGAFTTADLVGENPPRFAFVLSSSLIEAGQKEIKAKAIGQVLYTNPMGIVLLDSTGVRKPSQLKGKKIGFSKGEAPFALWPAFLNANGLKESDFTVVFMGQGEKAAALKAGKVDGVGLASHAVHGLSEQIGLRLFPMPYALNGLPMVGDAIAVNTKYLKDEKDRDLNCRFLRAAFQSIEKAAANPKEAVAAMKRLHPELAVSASEASWLAALHLMQTRKASGKPTGYNFPEDWPRMIETLGFTKAISAHRPPGEYYTNDFIDCKKK